MMNANKRHIATLDGLRGFAALAVVLSHFTNASGIHLFPNRAYLAVDFFFVLSGYVVGNAYDKKLSDGMPFFGFLRVRLIRLYPLIFLGFLVGFLEKCISFRLFGHGNSQFFSFNDIFLSFLAGLILFPSYEGGMSQGNIFILDEPAWSLMFEILANAAYAFFFRFLSAPVLFGVLILSCIGLFVSGEIYGSLNSGMTQPTLWMGLMRVSFSFFMGVLLFRLFKVNYFKVFPSIRFEVLAAILLLSFLPGVFKCGWIYDILVCVFLYPAIVICGINDKISSRMVPLALFAGRLSYPIYILHGPLGIHFRYLKFLPNVISEIGMAVLASILLSYLALKYYDEPVRLWLGQLASTRNR